MSFTTIWDEHKIQLFNFIREKVDSDEVAEDILQDVALKFHAALEKGKVEKYKAWLFKVARNTIADFYRIEFQRASISQTGVADTSSLEEYNSCICDLTGFVVQQYLPKSYGEVLFLADIEKIPQPKIAVMMNLSLTATKSRVQRARKMLKELVENCVDIVHNADGSVSSYNLKAGCVLPPELLREMDRLNLSY